MKWIRKGVTGCMQIRLAACFIIALIVLSGCSSKENNSNMSHLRSVNSIDELFEENKSYLEQVANILLVNDSFWNWLYDRYEWHDLTAVRVRIITQRGQPTCFNDTEWSLIASIFDVTGVSSIRALLENRIIEYDWPTSERHSNGEIVHVHYRYSRKSDSSDAVWFRYLSYP